MPFPLQRTLDPVVEPVCLAVMKNYLRVDIDDDDDLINSLISMARERAEDLTGRCLIAQEWTFSFDRFPFWYGQESGVFFSGEFMHHRHRHSMFRSDHYAIILPRGPVLSVESITYKDLNGDVQTLDPILYEVDLLSQPARIRTVYNGSWPVALWDTNSITIKFIAGYQQTVTEVLTLSDTAPFAGTVTRSAAIISLNSAQDVTTGDAIVGVLGDGGSISFATGTAGQTVQVSYQVPSIPQSFLHAIKLMCGAWYENRAEVVQGGGNFNSMPTPMSASSLLGTYELFPVGYPKS
jgi:hypothetical protein